MSKTLKKCFDKKLTFTKMMEAHYRARKGKTKKKELIIFEMDLETNIVKMVDEIANNKYKFGEYREFNVYEPKERIIRSLPYRDRIVHQWYVEEFIKPYFFKRFIKDTYACLDGRGTHIAVKNTQKYMRKMKRKYGNYYVLKCDVKKYFYSIDKNILINILRKRIADNKIIEFSKVILDDGNDIGIPIGNYTSQYFANIYLNELDYYVKNKLNIEYYVRYMDDFVILVQTKEEAMHILESIRWFLKNTLKLELNHKSKYFPNRYGIDFCGYRIYETHILLRKRFKKKVKKSIILWKKLKRENKFNKTKYLLSINSIIGHASHANSFDYIYSVMDKIENELII